jgi:hypothetical protein
MKGVWKLEIQRRGSPHFHLLVRRPAVPVPVLRRFVSQRWFSIVASGDLRHLRAGTQVLPLLTNAWQYLVGELAGAKGYQEVIPDGCEGAGRWWGVWGLRRPVEETEISESEFYALRRCLRRLGATRGYRPRHRGAYAGFWLLSRAPAGMLADALNPRAGPTLAAAA